MKLVIIVISLFVLAFTFPIAYFDSITISNYTDFRLLHLITFLYTVLISFIYFRKNKKYLLINPLFTSLILTVGLNFGVFSNFVFFVDKQFLVEDYALGLNKDYVWHKISMFHVIIAVFGLFLGNLSAASQFLYRSKKKIINYFAKPKLRYEVANLRLYFVYLLTVIGKLYLFKAGMFGRLVALNQGLNRDIYEQYSQYLNLINSMSIACFMFIAYNHYSKSKSSPIFIYIFLIIEIFFGLLAGSRGTFLTPFLVLGVAHYFAKRYIRISHIVVWGFALYIAMVVVVPLKNFYGEFKGDYTNAKTLITEFVDYYRFIKAQNDNSLIYNDMAIKDTWYFIFLHHSNYSTEIAAAIRHKSLYSMPANSPNFLEELYLAPVYAVVPRFIWANKSKSIHGLWFREEVLGYLKGYGDFSIAMTPIAYLYFAGKSWMVFVGFWVIGVLQRSCFLFLKDGLIGLVIFMVLFSGLYFINSDVHSIIVNYIRNIIFAIPVIFLFIYSRKILFTKNGI